MAKKYKAPKIKEGHSLDEYIKRFGKQYINLKLKKFKDKKDLESGKRYWKIGEEYYQVSHSRALKVTLGVLVGASVAANVFLPIYFCVYLPKEKYIDYNFKYWNDNASLTTLKNYVKEVVNPDNKTYIPKIDRIATFDMDGTLFGERAPIYIEWLMFEDYLALKEKESPEYGSKTTVDITYKDKSTATKSLDEIEAEIVDFKARKKVDPLEMDEAYGGAKLFSGLTIPKYIEYVDSFLEKSVSDEPYKYFSNLKFKDMFYKPMIEVVEFLQVNNFDVYIVSGTDRFMVRDIVNKHISIPYNKVIGMDVSLNYDEATGVVTRGEELKYKNVEKVKVELIAQEIGKKPVLSFGNSTGDVDMHDYCLSNEKYKTAVFMVNNDDDVREYEQNRSEEWKKHPKYNVFSMKDNWKTIYGDNVKKIGK